MITRKQALYPVITVKNKVGMEQQVVTPVEKTVVLEASSFVEGNNKLYEEVGIIANRIVKEGKSFGFAVRKACKRVVKWVEKRILTLNMTSKANKLWEIIFAKRYRQALKILKQTQIYMAEMAGKGHKKAQPRKLGHL